MWWFSWTGTGPPESTRSETQLAQLLGVALPILGDAHVEVQVHRGAEQRLDLPAGGRPDVLEPGTALADDDALLAVAFDVELRADVQERVGLRAALARHHFLDDDRER